MLEYFTYKKIKKHQAEKKAQEHIKSPLITEEDEHFLTRIVSAEGTPPPLPERPRSTEVPRADGDVGEGAVVAKNKENERPIEKPVDKKKNRLSFLYRKDSKKVGPRIPLNITS